MANYIKATDFTSKDALLTGDPNKIVRGSEIDDEFDNIQTAVNSKADSLSPTLTGTPLAPTASVGTNTTQIATTAFVNAEIANDITGKANIASPTFTGTVTTPTLSFGGSWTVVESGGLLYFKYGGVNKAKLDSSGNLTVAGNVTAFGSV